MSKKPYTSLDRHAEVLMGKKRSCLDCRHYHPFEIVGSLCAVEPVEMPPYCTASQKGNLRSFPFLNTKCRDWKPGDLDAKQVEADAP